MSSHEIHHEVWIDAALDTVYDAITTREGLDAWWGPALTAGSAVGEMVEFDHGHSEPIRMRIVEIVPGERLVWKCENQFDDPRNPASEWHRTTLEFSLVDGHKTGFESLDAHFSRDRFTILTFRHAEWAEGSRWLAFCNYAWGVTLAGLANHCVEKVRSRIDANPG